MRDYMARESTAVEDVPVEKKKPIRDMIAEAKEALYEANLCMSDLLAGMSGSSMFDGSSQDKPKSMREEMEDVVGFAHICMKTAKRLHEELF